MAKMFYSLEEAAEKLGKSTDDVRGLVESGQLQEFRDRDRLMFKREQVDLLAGDDASASASGFQLADSKGGSGLSLSLEDSGPIGLAPEPKAAKSGSGEIAIDDKKDRSGISIFDTESTEEGDANAVTRITETAAAPELSLESVGSGSGLLDLTREGDDTSLGADLLEDVYKGEEEGGAGADTQGASGLFEPTAAASDVSAGAAAAAGAGGLLVVAEPYDGAGSGLAGGAALAGVLVCAFALVGVIVGLATSAENVIANLVAGSAMMWLGIGAAIVVLCIVLGWVLGKRG
jgi:hypothetical protein